MKLEIAVDGLGKNCLCLVQSIAFFHYHHRSNTDTLKNKIILTQYKHMLRRFKNLFL